MKQKRGQFDRSSLLLAICFNVQMRGIRLLLFLLFSIVLATLSSVSYALADLTPATPWRNRLITNGGGLLNRSVASGYYDALIPLIGDDHSLFFFDNGLDTSSVPAYLIALGLGERFVIPSKLMKQGIGGGFTFLEYQYLPNKPGAWFIDPGVELILRRQAFRLQGYLPLSTVEQPYAHTVASLAPSSLDNINNINQYAYRSGHSSYDTPVTLVNSYGRGLELTYEQQLPIGHDVSIKGFYYHYTFTSSSSINGIAVKLRLPIPLSNQIVSTLELQDNYDAQNRNTVFLTLKLEAGGPTIKNTQDVRSRMEVEIDRNMARKPYALISPTYNRFVPTDVTREVSINNWYFSTNGTLQGPDINFANCTNENPCSNITQSIADGIQQIDPGANLYFATGTYTLEPNSTISGNPNIVLLHDKQHLLGLTSNFAQPASGGNRPLILGGLFWGNNSVGESASGLISNLQITNQDNHLPAVISGNDSDSSIAVGATHDLTISNSTVSATGSTNGSSAMGVWAFNGNLSVDQSSITAVTTEQGTIMTTNYFAYGLRAQNGLVQFTNGTIQVSTEGDYAAAFGINGSQGIIGRNLNVTVSSAGMSADVNALFTSLGDVSVSQSSQIRSSTASQNADAYGIQAGGSNVSINDTTIIVTSDGDGSDTYGILGDQSFLNLSLSNSTVSTTSSGVGASSTGLTGETVNFINGGSFISSTGTGLVQAILATTINNNSSPLSQCQENGGAPTTC